MKHDLGESEHKHLCITDTLKNAWPLKCHNSVKHFFFILVLRNFEDKLNFAFASLLKSGSTTVLSWERPPWWTCGLGAQRISPSALLCSVLPPTFPPSSFPSFPFFFPLANSQGCGHDRWRPALGWGGEDHIQGSCPTAHILCLRGLFPSVARVWPGPSSPGN